MKVLYPFQKEILDLIYTKEKIPLFLQMRLGKTLITIRRLRREKPPFLIVAPNDALISWQTELESEGEKFIVLQGSKKKRLEKLNLTGYNYFLINKEGYIPLPELRQVDWTAVILDESPFIKNPKAKVTKFFLKNFKDTRIKITLTGTPNPKSDLDYIPQLLFLNPEWLKVNKFWDFRARHCYLAGFEWKLKEQGKKILASALSNAIFRTREDVGIYIPKVYTVRELELPSKLQKIYDSISKNFSLQYNGKEVLTKYAMQVVQWQKQLATGMIFNTMVWKGKYNLLLELLEGELKGEKIVLWTNGLPENQFYYNNLKKRFKIVQINGSTRPAERSEAVKKFNSGYFSLMVVQVSCATYGLNLSTAKTAIYLSCPVGYLPRKQSEDRILNVKGKESLLYIDLITKNTIEEEILQSTKDRETERQFEKRIIDKINKERLREVHK